MFVYYVSVFFNLNVYLDDVIDVFRFICSLSCCAEDVNLCKFVTFTSMVLISFHFILVCIFFF